MTAVLVTLLQLVVTAAKLCRPGGARAVIAENLLLRQQLLVLRRPRQRAPNLTSTERVLCGLGAIFLGPGRIYKVAIGVPSWLLTSSTRHNRVFAGGRPAAADRILSCSGPRASMAQPLAREEISPDVYNDIL